MESFVTAVRAVCFTAVGVCIVRSITDGTRLRGHADMLLKLIFATTLAVSFAEGISDFEMPDLSSIESGTQSYSMELYQREVSKQIAENISSVLIEQMHAAGIKTDKIITDVNISEDGSININRVIISTSDFVASARIVRDSIGQETEVINGSC